MSIKEIEFLVNLLTKNTAGPDNFTGESYQKFKEEIIKILHKLFHKIYEVCVSLLGLP